jgi:hypothetical protein
VLQQDSEEGVHFVHEDKFIVHLAEGRAEGDIRLIALTCADATDESIDLEPAATEPWDFVDQVEDADFSHVVLMHRATNMLLTMSIEPRASLDGLRFNAWMGSFLKATSRKLRLADEFRAGMLSLEEAASSASPARLVGAIHV